MTQLVDAARYAAVSPRVHGLFSRFLPAALWAELVAAPDLRTVYHLLQQTWCCRRPAGLERRAVERPTVGTRLMGPFCQRCPFTISPDARR